MTSSRKTILVLEDEPLIAIGIEDLVRDLGFSPIVCAAIEEALATLDGRQIDAAVLDHRIRKQDSEPVAQALRQRSIPFIVCSGSASESLTTVFRGAPFLAKPYTDAELQAALIALLGQ